MQTSLPSLASANLLHEIEYFQNNKGFNGIGSLGLMHLSKSQWKTLSRLDVEATKIGRDGMKWLGSADWKNL
jgi:hypothetical protein